MNRRLIARFVSLAQESRAATPIAPFTPMTWVTPDGSPEIRHTLALARMRAEQALPFQLDPPMKEVRLSSGAKTAIIITAIVVGALIIVGAVALSRPGKRLP